MSNTPDTPESDSDVPDNLVSGRAVNYIIPHNLLASFEDSPKIRMNGILADELENQRVEAEKLLSLVPEMVECGC